MPAKVSLGGAKVNISDLPSKLRQLQASDPEGEYYLAHSDSRDEDGDPLWDADDAESKLDARIPGAYAIVNANDGDVVMRAAVGRSREEALKSRRSAGEAVAYGSVGLSTQVSEAWAEQCASLRAELKEAKTENKSLRAENDNLKEQLLELRMAQTDEVPEELFGLFERGLSMLEGRAVRAKITEKFNGLAPRLIAAIGEENTVKVAMIVQEEFNRPEALLPRKSESSEEAEEGN